MSFLSCLTSGLNDSLAALTCFPLIPFTIHLDMRAAFSLLNPKLLDFISRTSEKELELLLEDELLPEEESELELERERREHLEDLDLAMFAKREQKKIFGLLGLHLTTWAPLSSFFSMGWLWCHVTHNMFALKGLNYKVTHTVVSNVFYKQSKLPIMT